MCYVVCIPEPQLSGSLFKRSVMVTKNGGKMGRPKIVIDWDQFDGLCKLQCTLREIAEYFSCSEDTIENRVEQEKGCRFSEYFAQKRVGGLISLRRTQFQLAESNPALAIFLGKNYLGQSDKLDVEGTVKGATQVRIVYDKGDV